MMPSLTVVVPSYRRPEQLAECLGALARSEYPPDRFEVIVVDDGSEPPLDAAVAPFRDRIALTLVRQANAGPAAARNLGARHARGEFLAFTDDDCLPEPHWLASLARALMSDPGCMVGGTTLNAATGSLCAATSQLIVDVVYRYYNADARSARFVASNNIALSARMFHAIGGFDPAFRTSEDRELCDRWRHHGHRIVHCPAARVWHNRPQTIASFCRLHFRYGQGAERFHRVRALRKSGSLRADARFHLEIANWLGYPLASVRRRQAAAVFALLALWQTANVAGFLWEKVRHNVRSL
jgi:GT2 family glycosyltransferase